MLTLLDECLLLRVPAEHLYGDPNVAIVASRYELDLTRVFPDGSGVIRDGDAALRKIWLFGDKQLKDGELVYQGKAQEVRAALAAEEARKVRELAAQKAERAAAEARHQEEVRAAAERERADKQRLTAQHETEAHQAGYKSYADMQASRIKEAEEKEQKEQAERERVAAEKARIDAGHTAEARKAGYRSYAEFQRAREAKARHMHERPDGFMHCDKGFQAINNECVSAAKLPDVQEYWTGQSNPRDH